MKTTAVLLLLMALLSPVVLAGEIYGTIKRGGRPIEAMVMVKIKMISTQRTDSTWTDKTGFYRIQLQGTGACILTVNYKKQSPSIQIYSYNNPKRYNLALITRQNGQYRLQRN